MAAGEGDIYAVSGAKEGANPSEFAPSPGGQLSPRARVRGCSARARPGRNARFLHFHEAWPRGSFCTSGAWPKQQPRQPNTLTLHPAGLVKAGAGNQTRPKSLEWGGGSQYFTTERTKHARTYIGSKDGVTGMNRLLMSLLSVLTISTASAGGRSDEAALLAFKAEISGHDSGTLAAWSSSNSSSFCSWEGVTCSHRRPTRVVALSLPSGNLTGMLSPVIGNLTFLRRLNLSANRLYGEIPPSIGRLRRLQVLDMGNNSFSGALPTNLSSCISLTSLILHKNQLGGRIPVELGNKVTRLQMLKLTNNGFTGPIPASLANLSSLVSLTLANNHLDGLIPPGIGNIAGLQHLSLYLNNLSGVLPNSLYNMSSLTRLQVDSNMLHGKIPSDIGSMLPSIEVFGLSSNRFSGVIPSSLSNLSTLTAMSLSDNRFTGFVPPTLGRLQSLVYLYCSGNRFEADNRKGWEFITSLTNCSQLQQLVLGENSFSGQLPGSIVNLSMTLQKLYLGKNSISGSIPEGIGNLVGLNILDLGYTSISGVIPESIGKLTELVDIALYNTSLSGLIPSSFGNLTKLNRLLAYYTNLEGPIPASLGRLKNLFILDLSTNRLNGSIPKEILNLPSLSFYLDLSYNSLSGSLPSEVGMLANLNQLILSGNQFSGQIPETIGNCIVLEFLLLDKNSFEGSIPQSLANLKGLSVVNLTMNKLSGRIPDAAGSIGNLQQLCLAHNNLSGPIPATASVIGNGKLCGGIPQLHLAPCPVLAVSKNRRRWPKSLTIALQQSGSSKSFEVECEALRRVRHRCLIKIITCCSSIDLQGQEFKALVFEFMPNGSLERWIHPKSSNPTPSNTLSLSQRLCIAVDILDALDYLHNHCQPPIIHCDLKPSNILLAEDKSARVGDFGISRILPRSTSKTWQNSKSSIGIRGSIGYVAPEYGEGSAVSRQGDIYSLGILLLEMFTGRSPTDDMFKDSLDLHKFAVAAIPDRALEIADKTIWLHDANDTDITDASITRSRIQQCLVSVLRLGISCSKQQPRERRLIADAAAEMHAIRDEYLRPRMIEHGRQRQKQPDPEICNNNEQSELKVAQDTL